MFLLKSRVVSYLYKKIGKPIFFLLDPEQVHTKVTIIGETFGAFPFTRSITEKLFSYTNPMLSQKICGISYSNPVGLSAGFDYEGRLTQIIPSVGFGFETIGTITHMPYEGNQLPRLGRLPKSKSLMVNKGFKNDGVKKTIERLALRKSTIPLGISIGMTNTEKLNTLERAIDDITTAFILSEKSQKFSYYEMNISCPNLHTDISFYPPKNLRKLLTALKACHLTKPVFIKMPLNCSNKEVIAMLEVIVKFPIAGVIFGNLQKDRGNKQLVKEEVEKFPMGNFSGKPTEDRSNELIALTYKKYHKRLLIIGVGGIFTGVDAYRKIRLGASLVALITGMIFEGPQVIGRINYDLVGLLQRDGFTHISQAIGIDTK